jgi:putative transposase
MPQSLSRVLLHVVFSTKNRAPDLLPAIQPELHTYLGGVLNSMGCSSIQVGGVEDHVHLFFMLSRTKTIAQVVEKVKTSSSKWLKEKDRRWSDFHWQQGYGAFSISQSDYEAAVAYVVNQAERHKKVSFQDEFRRLLALYQVEYDESHVWD